LTRRLAEWVVSRPSQAPPGSSCVVIGDSKLLYQPDRGLGLLETGLGAALAALGQRPATWRQMWETLAPGTCVAASPAVCYQDYDCPLPCAADPAAVARAAAVLCQALDQAGIRLAAIRSRALFPDAFNRLVDERGSKGSVLSHVTLGLAAELIAGLPDVPIHVVCDKHGGRDRYQPVLYEHFPDVFVEVHGEGATYSLYRFGPPERRIEFRFEVQAECYLATALASMASKYLRELAMRAWNAFWCARIEGLAPTAGYPADARRFQQAIAPLQRELAIDDRLLWRSR
jgi:hypothetical protein